MSSDQQRGVLCLGLSALVVCMLVSRRAPAAVVPEAEPVAISGRPASAETNAPSENTGQVDRGLREEQMRAARQLYESFPRSAAAFVLGTVCHEQGDVEAAIRYWEEEVNLEPGEVQLHDRAEALSNLGEVYLRFPDESAEPVFWDTSRSAAAVFSRL